MHDAIAFHLEGLRLQGESVPVPRSEASWLRLHLQCPEIGFLYFAEAGDKSIDCMIDESFQETMADTESRVETRVRGKGADESAK
jgi:hypothetical protein